MLCLNAVEIGLKAKFCEKNKGQFWAIDISKIAKWPFKTMA